MEAVWSEHWHDVRFMRPRLRDGVQILHRTLRGRPWVLLSDPLTQRFHRLSPQVWQVLQLLDGQRTLDQVWAAASAVPPQTSHFAVGEGRGQTRLPSGETSPCGGMRRDSLGPAGWR